MNGTFSLEECRMWGLGTVKNHSSHRSDGLYIQTSKLERFSLRLNLHTGVIRLTAVASLSKWFGTWTHGSMLMIIVSHFSFTFHWKYQLRAAVTPQLVLYTLLSTGSVARLDFLQLGPDLASTLGPNSNVCSRELFVRNWNSALFSEIW
jgi:hypothetical protein